MDRSSLVGKIRSIQPYIRLLWSIDGASHTYLGYVIELDGAIDGVKTIFSICISEAVHAKHQFKVNDVISGECLPVPDPDMESVDYYKVSKLKITIPGEQGSLLTPWELIPPELNVYKERGYRRLATRFYDTICSRCMWGCRMSVELITDNQNPRSRRKYRSETVCFGPISCEMYQAGPNRKVESRKGLSAVRQ